MPSLLFQHFCQQFGWSCHAVFTRLAVARNPLPRGATSCDQLKLANRSAGTDHVRPIAGLRDGGVGCQLRSVGRHIRGGWKPSCDPLCALVRVTKKSKILVKSSTDFGKGGERLIILVFNVQYGAILDNIRFIRALGTRGTACAK